jgi:transcriptional regulator with XRE-family HTH domain
MVAVLDAIDAHIGARVRQQRNLIGMSQQELGKRAGYSFQQQQKYERGIDRINASSLLFLAHILNVQVGWFYEGIPPELLQGRILARHRATPEISDGLLYRRETLELIRTYYRIQDPKKRQSVCAVLRSMVEAGHQ